MEDTKMLKALELISEGKLGEAREFLERVVNEEVKDKTKTPEDRIKDRIKKEFNEYKIDTLTKCLPEEIFDKAYKIYVLSEITDFFENEDGDLYEENYKILDKICSRINNANLLLLLYDYYIKNEFASMGDYDCVSDWINDFCETEAEDNEI